MDVPQTGHDPVLIDEVREALGLRPGMTYVDCTLGRGGHALTYGQLLGPDGLLIGLDADERNLAYASERLKGLPCRTRLFHANFSDLGEVLAQAGLARGPKGGVGAILADLGVSTNQLFDPQYGMSITVGGPLDMRLDPTQGVSAAEIVNRWPEERIADVLYLNGDERYSRRIARKIVAERRVSPILTTERLADIVRSAAPPPSRSEGGAGGIHPATRTFQALRMEANREVDNLQRLLQEAPRWLSRGGRLAVISFHSGEDRLVKQAFRTQEEPGRIAAGAGGSGTDSDTAFSVVGRKPISPTEAEVARNPRSRSAKLRVLERGGLVEGE